MIPSLQHLPVLVLGHGISGQAMARWCVRQGAAVTVADSRDDAAVRAELAASLADLARPGQPMPRVLCADFSAELLAQQAWGLVCKSPGLSPAQLQAVTGWASVQGVPVVGELALFAHGLRQVYAGYEAPRVLAITGTNGKTTTTALTAQLLARCGWRVGLAGNIGPALLDVLAQAEQAALAAQTTAHADVASAASVASVASVIENNEQKVPIALAVHGLSALNSEELTNEANEANAPAAMSAGPAVHPTLPQAWVLELSSFQLDGVAVGVGGFEPTAATVLNISQDHLDWHGSMDHYTAAKFRVFGQQALRVLNREDAAVMAAQPPEPAVATRRNTPAPAATVPPAWVGFGTDLPRRAGDWGLEVVNGMAWLVRAVPVDETRVSRRGPQPEPEWALQRLMPAEALRIRGRHNAANALAALALATAAGAPLAPMLHGLREYRGEPHRVESVAIIEGVEYFDDSKGTNVGATLAAIRGLGAERRLVMLMGGDGKGQDFAPLAAAVRAHVQAVVLIGRDAPALRAVVEPTGVPVFDAADLPTAVRLAAAQARSGEAVVLSPACASLDMFRNYAHRAQVFGDTVAELAAEQGTPGVGT